MRYANQERRYYLHTSRANIEPDTQKNEVSNIEKRDLGLHFN